MKIYKNPLEQAQADFDSGKITQGQLDDVAIAEAEKYRTYNRDAQEERRKAKKRYISEGDPNTVMKGWYSLMNRPSGFISNFRTYEEAWKRLQDEENLENQRRNKLIENYHNPDYPIDQFESDLLQEFLGNKRQAFEWLMRNGRRFK